MDAFLANISSFPTAIFTTLNVVVCGYWLLMVVGVLDLDFLDLDIDIDVDAEGGELSAAASFLTFFGLVGVPFTIILTVITVLSFVICYYAVHFGLLLTSVGWLKVASGSGIVFGSLLLSLPISGKCIKPLARLFGRLNAESADKSLLGATCTIRTETVDSEHGEAECSVNGASLIIKVRSDGEIFKHGEKAVVIEHDIERNLYHIVSTKKFDY